MILAYANGYGYCDGCDVDQGYHRYQCEVDNLIVYGNYNEKEDNDHCNDINYGSDQ